MIHGKKRKRFPTTTIVLKPTICFRKERKVHNAMGFNKKKKDSCCFFCLLTKMMSTTKVKTCDA
jgi:hypothetical protein